MLLKVEFFMWGAIEIIRRHQRSSKRVLPTVTQRCLTVEQEYIARERFRKCQLGKVVTAFFQSPNADEASGSLADS
ncbi:hypothetical protein CA54_13680 [Symmachiella macrocystis]|uniref:Uncharacterized protein n=1 Tax=Symmachiella macrocystis TaxID=2527985 RepID=A0A5C6BPM4_9PLAN|nr:hypothetical protein CA54_13680 [Symmachiella macrocystis]